MRPRAARRSPEQVRRGASRHGAARRAVDAIVGERTAMRVDTKMKDGTAGSAIFNGPRLSDARRRGPLLSRALLSRGDGTGRVVSRGGRGRKDRKRLLEEASKGCDKRPQPGGVDVGVKLTTPDSVRTRVNKYIYILVIIIWDMSFMRFLKSITNGKALQY